MGERPAQGEQRLTEPISSLVLGEMAPKESGELVARMRPTGGKSEVGQQRLSVPRPHTEDRARDEASLETAEQGQTKLPHAFPACPSIA